MSHPLWYTRLMLKMINKTKELNNELNELFADEVMMPMVKFAATLVFIAVIVDFGSQLIEAINILTK